MEIGGLMAYAFGAFLGNADIMFALLGWAFVVAILFIVLELYHRT